MALDPNTQKFISAFINSQFPRLYEEYGQTFIDFVTAYYEWMETEGPLFDSRRSSDYQDIDTTADRFLVYFKNKYLPNIQLETRSNVELLVKHSLDVYRSRGTIRSIDLLFRLVFGAGADVYYPFDDVFQTSNGDWFIPRYIEVSTRDDLNKFVGKEVTGITSGATAFVESWVRKKVGSKQIDILYISALSGSFVVNERINATNSPFDLLECPTMIGSLTSVTVSTGGTGFSVGDVIPLVGVNGYGGTGRVANVTQTTGTVTFTLTDGGYGYSANAEILVSEEVLSLTQVIPGANATGTPNYFTLFDIISQPLANINYESANGGHFANNDTIYTYHANGSVRGVGTCLAAAQGNSTNGQILVSILSGNLAANVIYNTSNLIFANVPVANGYNNRTATGNVISEALSVRFVIDNITGAFTRNETIVNGSNASGTLKTLVADGARSSLEVDDRVGVWVPGTTITGQSSGATANLSTQRLNVGVIDLVNVFLGDDRAPLISTVSGTTGKLVARNAGTGATFSISPTLEYPETIDLNTDLVSNYLSVSLNAVYGFPALSSANLATIIASTLNNEEYTIGRISGLVSTTPGTGYTTAPMARVHEKIILAGRTVESVWLTITGATGSYVVGDLITQEATDTRGLITAANSTVLTMQKLSVFNPFAVTSNSTTVIVASSTGTTANVTVVADALYNNIPKDIAQIYLGINASIAADASTADGTITNIQVLNSGWGYEPGETLSMTANGVTASGSAVLNNQGTGAGFYRDSGGFLSDVKKLHDNDYYQVSAYDIRSSVPSEKYTDMLKSLLHVAGTRAFSTFVHRTIANSNVDILSAIVTQYVTTQTGVSATASAGSVTVAIAGPITGVSGTVSAGIVTPSVGKTVTGVSATASPGTVTITASSDTSVTGVSGTTSAGAVTVTV